MYEELVQALRHCVFGDCIDCSYRDNCASLNTKAADAIEELGRQCEQLQYMPPPAWIPVTERLPKNIDDEVLVCTEDYGKSGLGFVTVATYDSSGWLECWDRKTYLAAVTHWMPLPEPPKEEQDDV